VKKYETANIRNVVLMSHSGAGKTTLAEALLFAAGATSRQGQVDNGTSIFDYTPEEIERKISMNLAVAWMEWKDKLVNIIDTPGYDDFRADVIVGSRVADACILVINATAGIQPGTLKAKDLIKELNLPTLIFINQISKPDVEYDAVLSETKKLFGKAVVPITVPDDKKVTMVLESDTDYKTESLESIAEADDSLTEKFLNEEPFTADDIARGLEIGMKTGKIIPLYSGDAGDNIGIKELLDGLLSLPSPVEREESKQEALSCLTFKTIVDPHFGDLKYIRVFSGTLEPGTFVHNSSRDQDEKINQVYTLKGKEREEADALTTGMIGALVKLKATHTGDTLTTKGSNIELPSFEFPDPQEKIAISPKTKKDEGKLSSGLSKLHEEDPTFVSFYDSETQQTIVAALGDLHLNVMLARLKQNFGVEVVLEKPKIHYRETITRSAEQQGKYKRQTGGHGQYGDCWIKFEPIESSKGIEFVDAIVGGKIPKRFIPSVEKGLREVAAKGVLAGFPTTGFRATLYHGSYHDVDSSDIAFKIAASLAFKEGMPQTAPTLLEPIKQVEVIVPAESMGDVMGELSSRRGKIERTDPVGEYQKITAVIPESELNNFSTILRSQTQGMGSFTQKFLRYEEMPRELQTRVIEEYKEEEKE
jgi:elongation factor G